MIESIVKTSERVSKKRTLQDILCKATEELGECATMVNKPTKEYKETLQEEVCDVINAVVDLAWTDFKKLNKDKGWNSGEMLFQFKEFMKEAQKRKLAKWENNYEKHNKVTYLV